MGSPQFWAPQDCSWQLRKMYRRRDDWLSLFSNPTVSFLDRIWYTWEIDVTLFVSKEVEQILDECFELDYSEVFQLEERSQIVLNLLDLMFESLQLPWTLPIFSQLLIFDLIILSCILSSNFNQFMQMLDSSLSSSLLILLDFDLIIDIFVEQISLLLLPSISKMLYYLDYLSSEIQWDLSVLTKSITAY